MAEHTLCAGTGTRRIQWKKAVCALLGIASLVLLLCLTPPEALSQAAAAAGSTGRIAMRVLAITAFAIFWWAGEVIADWLVAILMMLMWIMLAGFSFPSAFAGFSGSSVWLIVGAFGLAAGITKTGFFNRISWFLLRLFSPTFQGQVLALLLVGAVCAPLIPSATAKAVLGATVANSIANAMGYAPDSKGRYGLFAASFIGFSCTTPAFMSGSVFTYTMYGALPEAARADISWGNWLVNTLPWLAVVLAGCFFAVRFLFCPKGKAQMTREFVRSEYDKLGRMSGKEILSAVLLFASVLLWIFESAWGVPAAVTAMLAMTLCFALGILDIKAISTAIPWGLTIFIGTVLNLGSIFSAVGINEWLESLLTPVFRQMNSPVLIVIVITVIVVVLRFVLVSQAATVILIVTTLTPAVSALGMHPFIVGFITLAAEQCWFFNYQNVVYTPALSCLDGTAGRRESVMACAVFEAVALLGYLVSIPYWRLLGLL